MAGLLSRAATVIKAKFSKLLDRAENPAETLDYSYEQQLRLLQNVKRGIVDVTTSKKRLSMQTAQLEQNLVKLDTQAREALAAGRRTSPAQALERKTLVQQQLQDLDQQIAQLEAQQEKLVASEKQLQAKVEAFRSQKEVIKAQYSAAEAQVRIGEAATGIGDQMADTGLAIQRAKDKTEQMQARASAIEELIEAGTLEDITAGGDKTQLDRELEKIQSSSQVDRELARLKAEVGSGDRRSRSTLRRAWRNGPRRRGAMGGARQGRRERSYPLDTGATEDAASRRRARPGGAAPVSPSPPRASGPGRRSQYEGRSRRDDSHPTYASLGSVVSCSVLAP